MLEIGQRVKVLQSGSQGIITKVGLIEYEIKLDTGTTITATWWNVKPIE